MRKKIIAVLLVLAVIYGSFYLGHGVVASPAIYLAALVGIIPAAACLWVVLRSKQDRPFLLRVFVAALLLRYIVGYLIYYKRLQQYLGADADTYDAFGYALGAACALCVCR